MSGRRRAIRERDGVVRVLEPTVREFQNDTGTIVDQRAGEGQRSRHGRVQHELADIQNDQELFGREENVQNHVLFRRKARQVLHGPDLQRDLRTNRLSQARTVWPVGLSVFGVFLGFRREFRGWVKRKKRFRVFPIRRARRFRWGPTGRIERRRNSVITDVTR